MMMIKTKIELINCRDEMIATSGMFHFTIRAQRNG